MSSSPKPNFIRITCPLCNNPLQRNLLSNYIQFKCACNIQLPKMYSALLSKQSKHLILEKFTAKELLIENIYQKYKQQSPGCNIWMRPYTKPNIQLPKPLKLNPENEDEVISKIIPYLIFS